MRHISLSPVPLPISPGRSMTVGKILAKAAEAIGCSVRELLEKLAEFARPESGHDSEPSRETLLSYAHAMETRAAWRFAAIVVDYLSDQQRSITNEAARADAANLCLQVLSDSRHRANRFERPVLSHHDKAMVARRWAGAFALIRIDTSDLRMRQDLLVLTAEGKSSKATVPRVPKTYATYVSSTSVCRGSWMIGDDTLVASLHGFRIGYASEIATFGFGLQRNNNLLWGVMLGISTNSKYPGIVPAVAIRVPPTVCTRSLVEIGNDGDEILRSYFRGNRDVMESVEPLNDVLAHKLAMGVVDPSDVMPILTTKIPNPEELISEAVRAICMKTAKS